MKILIINYEFPPVGSGAANATFHLCCELARRGHDIVVLTSLFRGLPSHEVQNGFQVVRIPVLRRRADRCENHELVSFAIESVGAALGLARKERPDAVIAFFGFPCGPAACAVKEALGVPCVLSLRNADVPRRELHGNAIFQLSLELLVKWAWRRADFVVAVSAGLRNVVLKIDPSLPVGVIPNGVDTQRFHPLDGVKPSESGPIRLLYVGRLRKFKGVHDLIDALAILQKAPSKSLALDIIGDGPYRRALEKRVAALGLRSVVKFHGRVRASVIPDIYRVADVFVFPSHAEGMPNAVLEAMASGLPVIATDIEGNHELIRTGIEGILVPRGNPQALGQAILSLASDREALERCGRAARERASRFSWQMVADKYLDILKAISRQP